MSYRAEKPGIVLLYEPRQTIDSCLIVRACFRGSISGRFFRLSFAYIKWAPSTVPITYGIREMLLRRYENSLPPARLSLNAMYSL